MIAAFITRFWVYGALIAALLGVYFVQQNRVDTLRVEVAEFKAAQATAYALQQADLREFARAGRAITDKLIEYAKNEKAAMALANSDLERERSGLRTDLANYVAINRALRTAAVSSRGTTGTASTSLPTDGSDALDILAGMFSSAEGTSSELAQELGNARQRGLTCEAWADKVIALSKAKPSSLLPSAVQPSSPLSSRLPAWHSSSE